jgi:2-amino-4-hydroxy-6-hydroxymethyldihydropteridine diphosphokinase
MPVTAYIALGANLGDRRGSIARAIDLLRATPGVTVTKTSSLLENAAVGGPPDSPPFLNGAVEVHTTLAPRELLARLLEIERALGRERREKWGPRSIDLDLLLYGDRIVHEPDLIIPHPLMHTRPFVLDPLNEIAPDTVHPGLRKRINEIRSGSQKSECRMQNEDQAG